MNPRNADREAGFTLIELMISLGLFALIAVAGLALVEGVIRVQDRTETRLDRLADLQRAMFVISSDVDQITGTDMRGNPASFLFKRIGPAAGGPAVEVRYSIANGNLVRQVGSQLQTVLGGVSVLRWRYWDGAWHRSWPVEGEGRLPWPLAVEVQLETILPNGAKGEMRRVVALPARAEELQ